MHDTDACEPHHEPIRHAQVLDSIRGLAVELRDGLAPLRFLPDLHKVPCVDHKILAAKVSSLGVEVEELKADSHRLSEAVCSVDKRLDVGFTRIESSLASYGRFLMFLIAIIPLFVGLTVWIVQRVPPNPIVRTGP